MATFERSSSSLSTSALVDIIAELVKKLQQMKHVLQCLTGGFSDAPPTTISVAFGTTWSSWILDYGLLIM